MKELAKKLCEKSGCHHKCNDTKDCVVEDEAREYLPFVLTNDENVSVKVKQIDRIKLNRNQDRRARFTDEETKKMCELYAKGYTQKAIAELYGTHQSTVCYIVSENAHKHIAEYKKVNPPKRRTTEEARLYMRDLRKYKRDLMKGGE